MRKEAEATGKRRYSATSLTITSNMQDECMTCYFKPPPGEIQWYNTLANSDDCDQDDDDPVIWHCKTCKDAHVCNGHSTARCSHCVAKLGKCRGCIQSPAPQDNEWKNSTLKKPIGRVPSAAAFTNVTWHTVKENQKYVVDVARSDHQTGGKSHGSRTW